MSWRRYLALTWTAGLVFMMAFNLSAAGRQPDLRPYQVTGWLEPFALSLRPAGEPENSPYYDSQELFLSWAIINDSEIAIDSEILTTLYLDGQVLTNWTLPNLAAAHWEIAQGLSLGRLSTGLHSLRMVIDPNNQVEENNEQDNTYEMSFTVLAGGSTGSHPNLAPYLMPGWSDRLVVSSMPGSRQDTLSLYAGQPLYLSVAIANLSDVPVNDAFVIRVEFDGQVLTNWFAPLQSPRAWISWTDIPLGPLRAGTHILRLLVDANGMVVESDESDNVLEKMLLVQPADHGSGGNNLRILEFKREIPGGWLFHVAGPPGGSVAMQGSHDLKTWRTLELNESFSGSWSYTNRMESTNSALFFRAIGSLGSTNPANPF